jgi:hypothetical protein
MSNRGKPRVANSEKDQCQALTVMTEWKRKHGIDQRRPYAAKFDMKGKRLCLRHAFCEALAIAVKSGDAKLIPAPPRLPYQPVLTIKKARSS